MPPEPGSPRRNRLCFVLVPSLLFVLIPAFVLKENIDDLGDFDPRAFIFLAVVAVAASLLLLGIDSLVRRATGSPRFSAVIEYVCFFVVITGFVLPASKKSGMTDPSLLDVDTLNVVLASLLALMMALLARSGRRKPLYVAVSAFTLLNFVVCVPALLRLSSQHDSNARTIFRVSSTKNILVLSFDGVSGSAVRDVLHLYPELEESFSGFVFYDRVASSSPATSASTAASLYGNRNFKEEYDTEKELWMAAPRRLLTNYLEEGGFEVSTYGIYNKRLAERTRRHGRLLPRAPASVLTLLNYSLARALTRFAVLRMGAAEQVEEWLQATLTPPDPVGRELMRKMSASKAPRWKRARLTPTLLDFLEYVRRLHVGGSRPVAHFLHFTYTHFPVEFDRQCRFMGDDPDWYDSRQNEMGAREETRCVLKQAGQFLGVLKTLGVFDRSLVILKSDHGKPPQYGEPGSLDAASIRHHWRWGYGRYRPFLAIKDFGQGHPGVRHDGNPVMLDDLARTLCRNADIAGDCADYPGYDLLGDDLTGMENDEVTLFVVQSPESTYRYETHDAVTLKRGADVVTSLCRALSAEPGAPDVDCDGG